jgi:hypothetical protein
MTDEIFSAVNELFPGARRIKTLGQVDQSEYDLLIGDTFIGLPAKHLFVMAFGCAAPIPSNFQVPFQTDPSGKSRSRALLVPNDLPPSIRALVEYDLLPVAKKLEEHAIYRVAQTDLRFGDGRSVKGTLILGTGDGGTICAMWPRSGGTGHVFGAPAYASPIPWIRAVVGVWHELAPDLFPARLDWTEDVAWFTPEQASAAAKCHAIEAERQAALDDLAARERDARQTLEQATERADAGPRLLLTGTGDGLAAAVAGCLRDMGFVVKDMDEVWNPKDKREDFRISLPVKPDWTILGEAKGLGSSRGKTADLTKMVGRGRLFERETGRPANGFWYIVNHDPAVHPADRLPVLHGSDDDLGGFGAADGLAIDTVDLFRLWCDVTIGQLSASDARDLLIGARGRFAYGR